MGITAALVFGNFGAAYGTAKSGVGVCSAVVLKPELLFKSIIPIVMAGILGIYGLIVAVLFNGESKLNLISFEAMFRSPKLIFGRITKHIRRASFKEYESFAKADLTEL